MYFLHDWQIAYFQTYVSTVSVCIVCVVALSALPNKHGTQALLWRDCFFLDQVFLLDTPFGTSDWNAKY